MLLCFGFLKSMNVAFWPKLQGGAPDGSGKLIRKPSSCLVSRSCSCISTSHRPTRNISSFRILRLLAAAAAKLFTGLFDLRYCYFHCALLGLWGLPFLSDCLTSSTPFAGLVYCDRTTIYLRTVFEAPPLPELPKTCPS